MSNMTDLDEVRREAALRQLAQEQKDRMANRWPKIEFESALWPLRSMYKTAVFDINLSPILDEFSSKDPAYGIAIRCLMAEVLLNGEVKTTYGTIYGWRLMSRLDAPLAEVRRTHLMELEAQVVKNVREERSSSERHLSAMQTLSKQLDWLNKKGVVDTMAWRPSIETKGELNIFSKQNREKFKASKISTLDRQIEALSDAMSAMFTGDSRLASHDRVVLAVMGIIMCAPSRINEPLCMSLDDRFTLEDYVVRPEGLNSDSLHRVHQLLLVKGSKGANWGAKPILNFMIGLVECCFEVIKQHGQRSRMLVQWYEKHPNTLYLPPQLEYLRGKDIDRSSLLHIMYLSAEVDYVKCSGRTSSIWKDVVKAGVIKEISNQKFVKNGGRQGCKPMKVAVPWSDLESILLVRVRNALEETRHVTQRNHYDGRLANMLMLFDRDRTPYLPSSIKYCSIKPRLKQTDGEKNYYGNTKYKLPSEATLFEKLDIKMVANGTLQPAWIDTHDPRRWLTTQALAAKERLSDVLINKWANRLNIDQLKNYDFRPPQQKADQAAMPEVNELADLSLGLQAISGIESKYGLTTEIVAVHDAGISVTSMDAIVSATGNRPVARTSNQIIIIYATKYGACMHQHHEMPCRAYKCLPCDNNLVVKGHLPTNEQVRLRNDLLLLSIVNQIEPLLTARHREIADDGNSLDAHIVTLVREGLNAEQMAGELIDRFHEIKNDIKNIYFKNKLEEAFVAKGMVEKLDNPGVASGALIKYQNPSCHAAPGHERAIDAVHGGRGAIQSSLLAFESNYPEFASTSNGLKDERHLLEAEND